MSRPSICFDFESRSYADLGKVGAWAYSEDPTTDVICACWGIDNEPIQEWWPGKNETDEIPFDLYHALYWADGEIEAHNVAFERAFWMNVMARKYRWPIPKDHQWRDLMAVANYYAMPPKLDKLAVALGFQGKNPEGGRLISKYSKLYLKTAKLEIPDEDFDKWVEYCKQDVRVEQSVSDYLGDLPEREMPIFQLNQTVNLRGLYLDLEGIEAATAIVEKRSEELTAEFRKLTGFNPTQRDRCMEWFAANGLALDNMQGDYLEELLEDEDDPVPQGPCRRALEIRIKINKASTKKLDAMARQRGMDGRSRFQTRYHGAQTGRETASGFQILNMSKGFEDIPPDNLVNDIMYGDARWLDTVYGDALDAVSKATRHWIKAEDGNQIIAGDFVSIEAVVLACLAGEEWKVKAFRDGVKLYELMGDKIYNLPPGTVTKKTHPQERFDGKTAELAAGYGGGLNAWLNFDSSGRHTDEAIMRIIKAWRAEHPMTTRLWREMEDAAIEAVRYPGRETGYREAGFETVDEWLSMILPNGKRIWYFKPELRTAMPPWHKPQVEFTKEGEPNPCHTGDCDCKPRPHLTYMAQKTGQWRRVSTWGGKCVENLVQAVSREVMFPAALNLERAGYPVILTVYDEIVAEVRKGFGSKEEFASLMRDHPPAFAKDWPINVDVWQGERYKK